MSAPDPMPAADALGLLCPGLAVAAVARTAFDRLRPGAPSIAGTAVAAAAVATMLVVPLGDATLAMQLRAVIGEPAAVTAVLLALAAFAPKRLPARPRPATLAGFAGVVTLLLWTPAFLGTFPFGFDARATGWRPWPILAVVAILATVAWRRRADGWVAVVGVALLCWGAGLVESDNLWDALVDPWIVGGCAAVGTGDAIAARRRAFRPSPSAA
ncbi:MAG: hypothetical protein ACKOF7_09605 [Phycisphaerales bacterium]